MSLGTFPRHEHILHGGGECGACEASTLQFCLSPDCEYYHEIDCDCRPDSYYEDMKADQQIMEDRGK